MRERPVLFSAPMVRAILDGSKTQTRRVVKRDAAGRVSYHGRSWHLDDPEAIAACPYGQPGDRLWVREAWGLSDQGFDPPEESTFPVYRADFDRPQVRRWCPSIHMPRALSRITLEVTSVRVERLQAISETDAIAEGVDPAPGLQGDDDLAVYQVQSALSTDWSKPLIPTPVARYVLLWDSINGKQPGVANWNANPWVWVVEFKRVAQ